jgi:hypothetical protein
LHRSVLFGCDGKSALAVGYMSDPPFGYAKVEDSLCSDIHVGCKQLEGSAALGWRMGKQPEGSAVLEWRMSRMRLEGSAILVRRMGRDDKRAWG